MMSTTRQAWFAAGAKHPKRTEIPYSRLRGSRVNDAFTNGRVITPDAVDHKEKDDERQTRFLDR